MCRYFFVSQYLLMESISLGNPDVNNGYQGLWARSLPNTKIPILLEPPLWVGDN